MNGLCDIACKMVFSRHLNQNCSAHGCFCNKKVSKFMPVRMAVLVTHPHKKNTHQWCVQYFKSSFKFRT